MHVRRAILCLATIFFWAAHDPDMASGQSSELVEAFNSYNTLYQQGRYSEAEPYAKEALRLGTEEFGQDDPTTADLLNNLALLYEAQGHYGQAEPLYKRSLVILEMALGPEHLDVAQSLNNLALLYHAQGHYAQAEPLYQRALAIFEKALGTEHPEVATTLNNLASFYYGSGKKVKGTISLLKGRIKDHLCFAGVHEDFFGRGPMGDQKFRKNFF